MAQQPTHSTQPESRLTMPLLPRTLLPTLFSSLSRATSTPTRWTLLRKLKSENPNDIVGELRGSATFTPLRSSPTASTSTTITTDPNPGTSASPDAETDQELLYSEEGSLPASFGPGLSWTKKYIWRFTRDGNVSVWFVKVDKKQDAEEEPDYLFHQFDFGLSPSAPGSGTDVVSGEELVTPPTPPEVPSAATTKVIAARGSHLCINDMYRTAYAFRVEEGSGEVVSWASRHVVRGPKKGQDIVNLYSREL
ncbi:hypothetical protein ASPCAL07195 [Aspergillus calidoustus]|uniref:DUF6314 domain-containing protein n=1 Tax=Aspergillus calidoustus TaxID=454130 RepID=A0A0U4Z8M3_ASPCI|nr:hypothetical protein ASPCAL07195 [Aspergillus calidoustus]